ncbi:MAG: tRNA 2-thiouridine(34) synthase MnmA [Thermodesulfobacteriota bacterium]
MFDVNSRLEMKKKRIIVAMSGGVDSATTAALLKREGHEVIGVTMQLWDYGESQGGCCSADEVCDARRVAYDLGIPHYVVNYMDSFKELIVSDFVEKYDSGLTPIPCILCNQFMKFNFLLKRALELDADYLATGHYASIDQHPATGKYTLSKAVDSNKDQSYFLFTLGQQELGRLMFPLGGKTKPEVRKLASEMGLKVAKKPESMGVCFITGNSYRDFIDPYLDRGKREGDIVDMKGNFIAKHSGVSSFTIGQRRGLGFANGMPMYVVEIDSEKNRVIVGEDNDLFRSELLADNLSWVDEPPSSLFNVKSKIRYRHEGDTSTVSIINENKVLVNFDKPQRAITPGQAIVFYRNDNVIGGGWIKEVH